MKNIYTTMRHEMPLMRLLHPYCRSDDIRRLVQPVNLLIYFVCYGLQRLGRSLLKAPCTALYRYRAAIYRQVYLAKLITLSPALLFEIHLRSRYVLITAVHLDEVVPYGLNYLLSYPAMRHMKFYVHKF